MTKYLKAMEAIAATLQPNLASAFQAEFGIMANGKLTFTAKGRKIWSGVLAGPGVLVKSNLKFARPYGICE